MFGHLRLYLGWKYLGVVPASWNEDFQLAIDSVCVAMSGKFPITTFFCFIYLFVFETRPHIAQASLKLAM